MTVSDKIFNELRKIDTPTITNVVATYPKNPLCLGLYNPWTENWYTDTSIRCMYPELGPTVGYAVTCVYGMPDPTFTGRLLGNIKVRSGTSTTPQSDRCLGCAQLDQVHKPLRSFDS